MIIWLEELVVQVFLWMLQLIDGIMSLFNAICGIDDVVYAGEDVNIIESTLTNSTITSVFWCIVIIGVGLACIFTIAAIIKNMITSDRSLSAIVGRFFLSILGTIAMLLVVILGILIANQLLKLLSDTFRLNTDMSLSTVIFNACAGKWQNGFTIKDFNLYSTSVSDLLGDYNTVLWFIPTGWEGNGMIDPTSFYYLPSLVASAMLCWQLLKALVSMARRLFEIVYTFFCMPVAMSTLPLDNGARFKHWTNEFISKIILAFGCILSVNIFSLLLPIYTSLTVPNAGSFANAVFLLVLIIGGASIIPEGQKLFVRIFSSGDGGDDGHVVHSIWHRTVQFGTAAALATTGAGMAAFKYIDSDMRHMYAGNDGSGGDDGAYRDSSDSTNYTTGSSEGEPFNDFFYPGNDVEDSGGTGSGTSGGGSGGSGSSSGGTATGSGSGGSEGDAGGSYEGGSGGDADAGGSEGGSGGDSGGGDTGGGDA
ncbi:MAG: hypothetical protein LUD50_01100 [Clostridia bacterium]|nr:hypothetical protein [Clostridia bacterium]